MVRTKGEQFECQAVSTQIVTQPREFWMNPGQSIQLYMFRSVRVATMVKKLLMHCSRSGNHLFQNVLHKQRLLLENQPWSKSNPSMTGLMRSCLADFCMLLVSNTHEAMRLIVTTHSSLLLPVFHCYLCLLFVSVD